MLLCLADGTRRAGLQQSHQRYDLHRRSLEPISRAATSSGGSASATSQQDEPDISGPPQERRLALLKRIAAFAGPALSIPLADPLMSLIDTIAIGQVDDHCLAALKLVKPNISVASQKYLNVSLPKPKTLPLSQADWIRKA